MSETVHRSPGFDVIVLAASYGGPAALATVLGTLPADLPAAVLVVQHRTPAIDATFTSALRRRTALPVGPARVEDPATARAAAMPAAALATGCVDLVLPATHLGHALVALTMAPGAADLFRVPPAPWARFAA